MLCDCDARHPLLMTGRQTWSHEADKSGYAVQDDNAKQGKFGFPVDNTIGGNPQPNGWTDSWVDFYRERRLRHMLRLVNDSRLTDMGERVAKNMDKMFEGIQVFKHRPSVCCDAC